MDNLIGKGVKQYRNVVLRSCVKGDHVVLADDSFLTDSRVGDYCKIERRGMLFHTVMGDYSYTGYNTVVKYAEIGRFCSISWNVSIGGANHDFSRLTTHPFPEAVRFGFADEAQPPEAMYESFRQPLTVGNDVWIGSGACILRGVSVGDGAVIGAGAVVTHDVPPFEIWAGVPARKIGQRFSDEIIALLRQLRWWDRDRDWLKRQLPLFQGPVSAEGLRAVLDGIEEE